jgi:hypothetical protein
MGVGVFVLGMHRSGTSAATRLANLLGIPTCVEDDFFAAQPDNPRGHWESRSLTTFNERLLNALGCDWSCPPILESGWESAPSLSSLAAEGKALFEQVTPTEDWVWKDPRNCVTLPFWFESLAARPVAVLVHRNPLSIAASLHARDGLPKRAALALWERYLRSVLSALAGIPTALMRYDELVDDPVTWCVSLRDFLDGAGLATTSPEKSEIRAFVAEELRHTCYTSGDFSADPEVTEPQRALFQALEELGNSGGDFVPPELPPESASTEALLAERRKIHLQVAEL